jgi:membrane-bound lytic murein transglycosylase A
MKLKHILLVTSLFGIGACSTTDEFEEQSSNIGVKTPDVQIPKLPNIDINTKPTTPNAPVVITNPIITTPPNVKPVLGEIIFNQSDFINLPDWSQTDINSARKALLISCTTLNKRPSNAYLSDKAQYAGKISDWLEVCNLAANNQITDLEFWTNNFSVWNMRVESANIGRLTSYFEPVINGNYVKDAINNEPLFAKPNDLLTINLGDFDPSLKPKTIVGRISSNNFVPYPKRAEITEQNARPLFYTNMGDAISLQIQGSGRINFPDGRQYRAVFTATNGRPFSSPASELIKRGLMNLNQASAGNVKSWFESADPKLAREIINSNQRTVFYELQSAGDPNIGPNGAQGVPLVSGGSLAIDPSYHAYGVPIFLSAYSGRIKDTQSLSRLVITQDTGGAIRGPIRGDLFWGTGVEAGLMAGRINHDVTFWALLPKNIDPTITNPKPKSNIGN